MISPIRTYRKNLTRASFLRKKVFEDFNSKYFKDPKGAKASIFESNERSKVSNFKRFIPGRIYTFKYDPIEKDILDFYDTRPIILVHGVFKAETGHDIVCGVNLNFLPEQIKAQVLELYWRVVKDDIARAEKKVNSSGSLSIIQRAITFLKDWLGTLKIFNDVGHIGYQFAYRNYIIDATRMKGVTIIEFEDWEYVPFFIPKEIKKIGLAKIYQIYFANKNELVKKENH